MSVKIYTTKSCPWCHKVKEFFKENKVKYTEIDVGDNENAAKEMVEKSGQVGVPVTFVDNHEPIVGFDEAKLKKALKL